MKSLTCLVLVVAVAALVAPAFAQPVLQAQQSLAWDIPYPAGETACTPDGCCTGPDVRYRLEWTLVGVPFGGNIHEFDLLYPPWPIDTACQGAVSSVHPIKMYAIAPGTRVMLAVSGVGPTGTPGARSNVIEVYWPWVCEGPTAAEFHACAKECDAVMGAAWCDGS